MPNKVQFLCPEGDSGILVIANESSQFDDATIGGNPLRDGYIFTNKSGPPVINRLPHASVFLPVAFLGSRRRARFSLPSEIFSLHWKKLRKRDSVSREH